MKKTLLIILTIFSFLKAHGQKATDKQLPFVLLIDNDVAIPSDTHGVFLIKDTNNVVKDSVNFDYKVGLLKMAQNQYDKLFKVNPKYNIFIKIFHLSFDADTTYVYEKRIPNKYTNGEFPNGMINHVYYIVKIFNKFNIDSSSKYYFKKNEDYIIQLITPGLGTIIPVLKKD